MKVVVDILGVKATTTGRTASSLETVHNAGIFVDWLKMDYKRKGGKKKK